VPPWDDRFNEKIRFFFPPHELSLFFARTFFSLLSFSRSSRSPPDFSRPHPATYCFHDGMPSVGVGNNRDLSSFLPNGPGPVIPTIELSFLPRPYFFVWFRFYRPFGGFSICSIRLSPLFLFLLQTPYGNRCFFPFVGSGCCPFPLSIQSLRFSPADRVQTETSS